MNFHQYLCIIALLYFLELLSSLFLIRLCYSDIPNENLVLDDHTLKRSHIFLHLDLKNILFQEIISPLSAKRERKSKIYRLNDRKYG